MKFYIGILDSVKDTNLVINATAVDRFRSAFPIDDIGHGRHDILVGFANDCIAQFVEAILLSRRYPEHGYRSCLGIVRLEKHYPRERIEAAANRALTFNSLSYRSLKSILAKGLDRFTEEPPKTPSLFHENIRGDSYYH